MIELLWQNTRIKRLRLMVPVGGPWLAEATFDKPLTLEASSTLQIGGVALAGKLLPEASDTYLTLTRARIGGGTGWRKTLSARSYHNDAGVTRASVLSTTAAEAGETLGDTSSLGRLLEVDYVRPSGRASAALDRLAPAWWVDYSGVTQVAPRVASEASSAVEVKAFDPISGVAELRVNEITDVAPAMTILARFSGPKSIRALEFDFAEAARVAAWLG